MEKLVKRVTICVILVVLLWCGTGIMDRNRLNEELIRLHVVANSDSELDQEIKLRVRDAVNESLSDAMQNVADVEAAKLYIRENLPKIEAVVNQVLREAGFSDRSVAVFCKEAFDTRVYDTFTLPAGVYETLRITIGNGEGKNWWCVVFPTLCLPVSSDEFSEVAAGAGFSDALSGALTGEEEYELRFFLLDMLGNLDRYFFRQN